MINDNYKTLITDLFGDFDVFIKSNIEYYVNKNKENLLSFSSFRNFREYRHRIILTYSIGTILSSNFIKLNILSYI